MTHIPLREITECERTTGESKSRAEEGHSFLSGGWPPSCHPPPSIRAPAPSSPLHYHYFPTEKIINTGERGRRQQRQGEGGEGAGECGKKGGRLRSMRPALRAGTSGSPGILRIQTQQSPQTLVLTKWTWSRLFARLT